MWTGSQVDRQVGSLVDRQVGSLVDRQSGGQKVDRQSGSGEPWRDYLEKKERHVNHPPRCRLDRPAPKKKGDDRGTRGDKTVAPDGSLHQKQRRQ
ncbi:hypothetical protein EYF80_031593 [Liparis tanakae]|uniref:Uncharacterized protein n=1 Tax=Liparis tanakae TaxID=230148 RepID=A0A4Z2GY15_9TELE|nr:hypothetical protein EYF80_031593 [Liparis tanakae]